MSARSNSSRTSKGGALGSCDVLKFLRDASYGVNLGATHRDRIIIARSWCARLRRISGAEILRIREGRDESRITYQLCQPVLFGCMLVAKRHNKSMWNKAIQGLAAKPDQGLLWGTSFPSAWGVCVGELLEVGVVVLSAINAGSHGDSRRFGARVQLFFVTITRKKSAGAYDGYSLMMGRGMGGRTDGVDLVTLRA